MAKLPLVARVLLGLMLTVPTILGFFGLFGLGEGPELEGKALDFMDGLIGSDYFWPFLKITEIVCGLMLLSGIGVPPALVILAPITTNIVLFHVFLEPATIVAGIVLLVLHLYLGYAYRSSFAGVLNPKAKAG